MSLGATRTHRCDPHWIKSVAQICTTRHRNSSATRTHGCNSHPNLAVSDLKGVLARFLSFSASFRHFSLIFSDLVPETENHPFISRESSTGIWSSYYSLDLTDLTISAWFEEFWRQRTAGVVDRDGNVSSTGFSFLYLFSLLDFSIWTDKMLDLAMTG